MALGGKMLTLCQLQCVWQFQQDILLILGRMPELHSGDGQDRFVQAARLRYKQLQPKVQDLFSTLRHRRCRPQQQQDGDGDENHQLVFFRRRIQSDSRIFWQRLLPSRPEAQLHGHFHR